MKKADQVLVPLREVTFLTDKLKPVCGVHTTSGARLLADKGLDLFDVDCGRAVLARKEGKADEYISPHAIHKLIFLDDFNGVAEKAEALAAMNARTPTAEHRAAVAKVDEKKAMDVKVRPRRRSKRS